jgi:uncharacterized membrane protein
LAGSYLFCFFGVIGLLARTGSQARRIDELTRDIELLKTELSLRGTEPGEPQTIEAVQTAETAQASEAVRPDKSEPRVIAPAEAIELPAQDAAAFPKIAEKPKMPSPALESLKRFARSGNLWTAGGILLLVAAFALLIAYLARRGFFTVEMGIAAAALSGLAMLFTGWVFRKRRPIYFLLLQGGGIGILYLSVFAAHKLTPYMPQVHSLILLTLLVLPAVILALLQNSQTLAVFGTVCGFAAPILLSDGSGNHVFLFAYYLVLDAGVLIIGFRRFWKWLDIISLVATFGVSLVWLFAEYKKDFFWTAEPFLLGFIAVFTVLGLRGLRKDSDGALVLATPIAGMVTQWRVFSFVPHGHAVICVAFAAAYLALTACVWRFRKKFGERRARSFAAGYLAFSVLLANLAIPLELQAEVTSAVWAAESAFVFVVGLWRKNRKTAVAGVVLHIASAVVFFVANADGIAYNDGIFRSRQFVGAVIVSLSAFVMLARLNRSAQNESASRGKFAWIFAVWAFCWWFGAWIFEWHRVTDAQFVGDFFKHKDPWAFILALCALTAGVSFALARALRCPHFNLGIAPSLLAAAGLVFAVLGSRTFAYSLFSPTMIWTYNFFGDDFLFPWLVFFAVHAALIFASCKIDSAHTFSTRHAAWMFSAFLVAAAVLSASGRAFTVSLKLSESWTALAGIFPSLAVVVFITFNAGIFSRSTAAHKKLMLTVLPSILRAILTLWFIVTLFMTGNPAPLPVYVPFINPLDLEQGFCAAAILLYLVQERAQKQTVGRRSKRIFFVLGDIMVFLWLTAIIARSVHFYAKEPLTFMLKSPVFHLTAFIVWALYGIAHIIAGHKRARRSIWIAGAAIIVCDVAKLLILDLAGTGTVMRIVSFFIAGGVMLFIGWVAPLPPSSARLENREAQDEK